MRNQSKITETTKDNLVKAFWSIYKEKDISKITVTEIIKKAGYNRSTFYCYFENVQAVLNYIEDTILKALNDIIYNRNEKEDFENKIFFDELVDFNKKYGEYVVFLLKKQKDSSFLLKFNKSTKDIFYKIHKKIEKNEQTNIRYVFIISALIGSFLYWNNNKEAIDEIDFLKLIFKLSNDTLY